MIAMSTRHPPVELGATIEVVARYPLARSAKALRQPPEERPRQALQEQEMRRARHGDRHARAIALRLAPWREQRIRLSRHRLTAWQEDRRRQPAIYPARSREAQTGRPAVSPAGRAAIPWRRPTRRLPDRGLSRGTARKPPPRRPLGRSAGYVRAGRRIERRRRPGSA